MKLFEMIDNEFQFDEQLGQLVKSEVGSAKNLAKSTLSGAFKDLEVAIGLQNNPIMLGKKPLTTADDVFNAIKNGSLTNAKELGRVAKGLLKSSKTTPAVRRALVDEFIKDKSVVKELTGKNVNEIKKLLKGKGYADESINDIISQSKKNGLIDKTGIFNSSSIKPTTTPTKPTGGTSVPNSFKEMIKKYSGLNYIKEVTKPGSKVRKFIFSKAAIVGLMVIGGAGFLLKSMFGNSDLRDENGNDVYKMLDGKWLPCIKNLLNSKQGKYVKLSNGSIGVQVTNDQYPNSIIFYDNGRVLDGKTKKMGTYKCKDGQIQQTNEQNTNNEIYTDVNTMIDLLDFPSTTQDLRDAVKLLEKYTTNGQGQRFLELYKSSGTGGGDLSKSLKYLYVKEPESVDNRNKMYSLIKQIQSGSTSKTIDSGDKTGSIDDIEITWDSTPTGSTKGGSSSTKKSIYHNCGKKDFPFEFGCINPKIGQLQQCLGVTPTKGYFGPKTLNALKNDGFDMSRRLITKDLFDAVIAKCEPTITKSAVKNTDNILSDKFGVDTRIPDELKTPIKLKSKEQTPIDNKSNKDFKDFTKTDI